MDSTNQGVATANATPGGQTAALFAMKRMRQQQQNQAAQRPGRQEPASMTVPRKGA
jgi:hypothetical protein